MNLSGDLFVIEVSDP